MRRLAFPLAASLVLIFGASCNLRGFGSPVVAVVGDEEITREMVAVRAKVLQGSTVANPETSAFAQIVQGYLAKQILDRYGGKVSDSTARAFWLGQNLPAAVRAVTTAASDELFLRAMARPDLATWLLNTMFRDHPELFQKEGELALRMHAELLTAPTAFDAAAARERLTVDRHWIGAQSIRRAGAGVAAAGRAYSDEEKRAAGELYAALVGLKAGEVYQRLLTTADAFRLFKVEQRTATEVLMAAITIPRPNFDAWFLTQVASIHVRLKDRELGKAFLQQVRWGRRLNVTNTADFPEFFLPPGD